MEEVDSHAEGPMASGRGKSSDANSNTTTNLLASVKEQELQFERLTRELEEERQIVASQLERCMLGAESPVADSSSSSEKSFAWRTAGDPQGIAASACQGHRMEAEEGVYPPEADRASLHDSEGSGGHSAHMTSYSDSGYQDSSVSYYSNQNIVRSEPRASVSRSPRAEGQASVQPTGRMLRRMASLPSRSQSPGCTAAGTVSPSRISLRTSQGSTYDSPILSEPKPLATVFPGTSMPPSCPSPSSPGEDRGVSSVGRLGSTLSLIEGRGLLGSPLRSGMTAVPQHYGATLPRQSQSLAYGADPYGLYQRSALPRPDSLIGVGTLRRATSHCSTLPYQRSSYGLNNATVYVDSFRIPGEPLYSHQHSELVERMVTRTPSIESIHKDPREFAWRDPELPEVIHMLQHHFPSVQANAAAYLQHLCFGDNRVKVEVCHLGGIQHLVDLLDNKAAEVQKSACGALRNLVYGKATDNNKVALRNCGGVPALLRLLRKTTDNEVRELVTGVLWNLSSCDAVKMTIIRDALTTLTNTVVIPHSGWSSLSHREQHKIKFQSSLLLRNTTGCLRNLSSAGEEARGQLRCCEGLVDSLLHILKACVNTSDYDSKIVENSVCTLRNLSYRLEVEMPSSRLLGNQELDTLLGFSTAKELDYICWGKRRRGRKRTDWPDEKQWDASGPIPGFSQALRGAELLWHPLVVKPYLNLLAESSNSATLEGAAGSLQNLSAGNWKFSTYIRAAVRKEKGLPILVELLRMDNDRVVCSVATALRNMALDGRNKELIGKYAMRDLINRLPGGNPSVLSDDTVASVCCTLHEVTSRNMENAKALADSGGIEKLVEISKGRGKGYSMKVMKAAAQVLNTLWQYRELRSLYKQDGWNYTHFVTPVSTLERDRYRSQPTLPTSPIHMPPVIQSGGSATSSPAMLGIRRHSSNYPRAQSSMQLDTYYGDNSLHKHQYTGSEKKSAYFIGTYSSHSGDELRRTQHPEPFYDEPDRKNYNRLYLSSPQGYGTDQYDDDPVHLTPSSPDGYVSQPISFKSNTNYVDFYSTTRRPSNRANKFTGSPDSWV
ncbi:plakophilin-4-like isoform X6 [Corythoichthys intestinalis]|uniref:plakophilin-4-like isoform X6 n=1 Tax=Corythoichthys intestinalis TaxID=161448 RepID=UPI0025A5BFB4|nr:plakophilin-4-like isoform X6 [Corythoichthys intestinalis]